MTKDVSDDWQFNKGVATYVYILYIYFFPRHVTTAPVGQGLLFAKASRSRSRHTTVGKTSLDM